MLWDTEYKHTKMNMGFFLCHHQATAFSCFLLPVSVCVWRVWAKARGEWLPHRYKWEWGFLKMRLLRHLHKHRPETQWFDCSQVGLYWVAQLATFVYFLTLMLMFNLFLGFDEWLKKSLKLILWCTLEIQIQFLDVLNQKRKRNCKETKDIFLFLSKWGHCILTSSSWLDPKFLYIIFFGWCRNAQQPRCRPGPSGGNKNGRQFPSWLIRTQQHITPTATPLRPGLGSVSATAARRPVLKVGGIRPHGFYLDCLPLDI